jgi:hypothetical protein
MVWESDSSPSIAANKLRRTQPDDAAAHPRGLRSSRPAREDRARREPKLLVVQLRLALPDPRVRLCRARQGASGREPPASATP